uniref:Uncharacterized protein n=1 Tax=Cacopsylla melanoneura TaxID=428564 RepID=A0A8D8XV54_9HEMI
MMALKFVLLAALCAAYVQGYPQTSQTKDTTLSPASPLVKKFKASVDKCKTSLSASAETVDLIGKKALPTDENQRCFLECVYKDLDIVKENKFDPAVVHTLAKEHYPEGGEPLTKATTSIDACAKEIVADESESCAMGKAVRSCFYKYADETNAPL